MSADDRAAVEQQWIARTLAAAPPTTAVQRERAVRILSRPAGGTSGRRQAEGTRAA